jgi:hypothetical protein
LLVEFFARKLMQLSKKKGEEKKTYWEMVIHDVYRRFGPFAATGGVVVFRGVA